MNLNIHRVVAVRIFQSEKLDRIDCNLKEMQIESEDGVILTINMYSRSAAEEIQIILEEE